MRFRGTSLCFALSFAAGCGLILDLEGADGVPRDAGRDGRGAEGDASRDAAEPSDAAALTDAGSPRPVCAPAWVAGAPPPFAVIEPLDGVNEVGTTERNPALSVDGLTLWFQRESSILVAHRPSVTEPFVVDAALPEPINAPGSNNGRISFTPDQLDVFLASTRDGRPSPDIWHGSRPSIAEPFATLTRLPPPLNGDASAEHDPHVSADEARLYYAPREADAVGGEQHIWVADRQPDGSYADARRVPELVVPMLHDSDPATSVDESIIFFARGHDASSADLMYAVREASGSFGPPTAIDALNTAERDNDPYLSADACELIFMRGIGEERDLWHAWVER